MKKLLMYALAICFMSTAVQAESPYKADFMPGPVDIKTMGAMTFGPDGILFIGDYHHAAIYAVDLKDETPNTEQAQVTVEDIDEKIAAMLGTTARSIRIHDMAVNPISQNTYLSVSRGDDEGNHILMRVTPAGKIEEASLDQATYAKKEITNPISMDARSRRGQSMRSEAITDLVYSDGALYVAGLSNEEFASTLRVVSFPFDKYETATSIEIYHAAHKKYETHAPIRTLMTYHLDSKPHVLASYTCTPLVTFPVEKLENGVHLKGKTVAEFGSGNRPLDMIAYENNGKEFILMANSNRALMKIDPDDIVKQKEGITTPVEERYGTSGIPFIAVNQVNVQQIDNLNDVYIIALQRMGNGSLNLRSLSKARL